MSQERKINAALLDAFRDLPAEDQRELARFVDLLERRAAQPDEPVHHAYAEIFGEVVYDETMPRRGAPGGGT